MKTLVTAVMMSFAPAAFAADCGDDFDPRGKIIGYAHPDGDPIYENLGPVVSHTIDSDPIYEKTGATYGHRRGLGNITGHTLDGEPLYDGESRPRYTIDGDRVTPLREKKRKNEIPGWM